MVGEVKKIEYEKAIDFILNKHYAGRKPQITIAFGWYINNILVSVCTFGKPASHTLCEGICGKQYSSKVYELNRLVRIEKLEQPLSEFVSYCLRYLKKYNWIIVSFADSGMCHHGYIYQACNFLYTGKTKQRTDKYSEGKHSRHSTDNKNGIRQIRTSKFRYVYFCASSKKIKKLYENALNYPILDYPKGDNKNYTLGNVYYPVLVDKYKHIIHRKDKYEMKIIE